MIARRIEVEHRHAARCRPAVALQGPDGRGLAGTVRPEKSVDRADRHVQIEIAHAEAAGKLARQPVRPDCK